MKTSKLSGPVAAGNIRRKATSGPLLSKELRAVIADVLATSVHDSEWTCRGVGPEACKRCVAMKELRKLMEAN